MPVTNLQLRDLPEAHRRQLEAWLDEFERSWYDGLLPGYLEVLRDNPLRQPLTLELVKRDLLHQWTTGKPLTVEDYLQVYPELGTSATVPARLLQAEFTARQRAGQRADLEEFERRFPQQAQEFRQLVLSARTLEGGPSPPPGDTLPAPSYTPTAEGDLPIQFGRYQVIRRLGQGGMGKVYLAHDTHLRRPVALKVPRFNKGDGPRVLERFQREARAAARLDHPNICAVHEVGEHDGINYLVLAYVEGATLAEELHRGRKFTPAEAAAFVRTLALVVQEAHEKDVIHRDLKPANIVINQRREPVIMDFGLARQLDQEGSRLTTDGSPLGTPAYMAPEQVLGEAAAMGPLCDVYSLGVILYELLTGYLPFQGSSMEIMAKVISQSPTPPSRYVPGLDPQLEEICLRAIARTPAHRHASAGMLANALGEWLARPRTTALSLPPLSASGSRTYEGMVTVPETLPTQAMPTPMVPAAPTPRLRRIPVAGVAVVVALLGLLGTAVAFLPGLLSSTHQTPSAENSTGDTGSTGLTGPTAPTSRTARTVLEPRKLVSLDLVPVVEWIERVEGEVGFDSNLQSNPIVSITLTNRQMLRERIQKDGFFLDKYLRFLESIPDFQHLRSLDLSGLPVQDTDLDYFLRLKNLQSLTLQGTGITDNGLQRLAKLKSLQSLDVRDNKEITNQAVAELRKALPGVQIKN